MLYLLVTIVIAFMIVFIIIDFPDLCAIATGRTMYFKGLSDLTYSEKLNVIFTFALVVFAGLEGFSTYAQSVREENRNRIDDARDELEKAYGPLYSILNYPVKVEEKTVKITSQDFKNIDRIVSVFPWMFSEQIRNSWNETRRPTPSISMKEMNMGQTEPLHDVSIEFRNMINEEYHQRVQRYNRLLGKE